MPINYEAKPEAVVLGNGFTTIAVPNGTNPQADSTTDSLNLTSTDSSITITGTAASDSIDFAVASNANPNTILTTRGDSLSRNATVLYRVPLGTKGQNYRSNGTDPVWQDVLVPSMESKPFFEDWEAGTGGGAALGDYNWSTTAGSGGTATLQSTVSNQYHIGVMRQRIATSTGFIIISTALLYSIGGGQITMEFLVRLEDLNNGTDDQRFQIGFGNTTTAAQSTQGVYWMYDTASTKWQFCTTASSSTTATPLGADVVADTWYRIGFVINDAATSIVPYISVAGVKTSYTAQTTNIPTAGTTFMSIIQAMGKLGAGSTNRDIFTDYVYKHQLFSQARDA